MSEKKTDKNALTGRRLVALSAPSGAGKSTICHYLIERNPDFRLSISATTRLPRGNEVDGKDYFFLSLEEFQKKIQSKDILEYEEIHGNYYGTFKSTVFDMLETGYTVLFDVGVFGALSIKEQFPEALLIFIKPPSISELRKRLKKRKTEDSAKIEYRLSRLPLEYSKAELFDVQVVNDDLFRTVEEIEQIIFAHQKTEK